MGINKVGPDRRGWIVVIEVSRKRTMVDPQWTVKGVGKAEAILKLLHRMAMDLPSNRTNGNQDTMTEVGMAGQHHQCEMNLLCLQGV